jgi:hypothetical protein
MEKILQEFRIIETDDGFRIEIKGDKEQLREFVMNLDPRRWMHGESEHGWGPFPFGPGGPRFKMRFKRGFGPFGFAWMKTTTNPISHAANAVMAAIGDGMAGTGITVRPMRM